MYHKFIFTAAKRVTFRGRQGARGYEVGRRCCRPRWRSRSTRSRWGMWPSRWSRSDLCALTCTLWRAALRWCWP